LFRLFLFKAIGTAQGGEEVRPLAQKILTQFIAEHEARQERRAEKQAKQQAEGAAELDCDAEREELDERLNSKPRNLRNDLLPELKLQTLAIAVLAPQLCVQILARTFSSRLDRDRIIASDHGASSPSVSERRCEGPVGRVRGRPARQLW
jgi:hypothetical protein